MSDHKNVQIALRYVKYNGWIFSGKKEWSLEKVTLLGNYRSSAVVTHIARITHITVYCADQDGGSKVTCDTLLLEDNVPSVVAMASECPSSWPLFFRTNFLRTKPSALINSLISPLISGQVAPSESPTVVLDNGVKLTELNNEIVS